MSDGLRMDRPRTQERGAALVLTVAILGVGVVAWQVRASLSQLIIAQQMLDQATAAAALTAAQYHARLLNAHAFLNRTAMAHQVAMAHLLTIASAEKLRLEMGRRFLRRNPPVYLIGMMFGPQHAAAYAAAKLGVAGATDQGVRSLQRAFVAHDQALSGTLSHWRSQLQVGVETTVHALVREVLARNLTRDASRVVNLQVTIVNPAGPLPGVVLDRESALRRSWFDAVMRQHDYLQSRRNTAYNWWIINPKCPLMLHQLRRRGQTRLSVDGDWQANDTLSFHSMRGHHWLVCYWREYPMGWSKIDHHATDRGQQTADLLRKASPEATVGGSFLKYIFAQHALGNLLMGLNNILAEDMALRTRIVWNRRSRWTVVRLQPSVPAVTQVSVRQALASLGSPIWMLGLRLAGLIEVWPDWRGSLQSRSAAQVYFDRGEPRADGLSERANLFQPFWGARNVLLAP